jgi:hypothetical protein
MQWGVLSEKKQKNQLSQPEIRFIKTIIMEGGAITRRPSPPHQRCTAAKDGQLQGGLRQQTNAVEFVD